MKHLLISALLTGAFCALSVPQAQAQDPSRLDSLYAELDELFAEDSLGLDLFLQTDSLLQLMSSGFHSLSIRGSFTSEVLTSGRDLGFSQNGLISGISYYHPSGIYGEITGFMNSEYSPQYYLTDLGAGYMWSNNRWMLQAGHNFMFFDESVDWLFDKNAQASVYHQRKSWEAGLDYRFMYGRESAHRITGTAASRLTWQTGWIDRITLIPSVAVQWGNASIIYFRQSETPLADLYGIITTNEAYPDLQRDELRKLAFLLYRERYLRAVQLLSENGYTQEDISNLFLDFESSQYNVTNSFGLMNMALNLGLSLSKGPVNLYLNYSYNFPQALPGEDLTYEENDYLSISLFYTLIWAARK